MRSRIPLRGPRPRGQAPAPGTCGDDGPAESALVRSWGRRPHQRSERARPLCPPRHRRGGTETVAAAMEVTSCERTVQCFRPWLCLENLGRSGGYMSGGRHKRMVKACVKRARTCVMKTSTRTNYRHQRAFPHDPSGAIGNPLAAARRASPHGFGATASASAATRDRDGSLRHGERSFVATR